MFVLIHRKRQDRLETRQRGCPARVVDRRFRGATVESTAVRRAPAPSNTACDGCLDSMSGRWAAAGDAATAARSVPRDRWRGRSLSRSDRVLHESADEREPSRPRRCSAHRLPCDRLVVRSARSRPRAGPRTATVRAGPVAPHYRATRRSARNRSLVCRQSWPRVSSPGLGQAEMRAFVSSLRSPRHLDE